MHDIPVRMISRVTSSSLNNNSWMGSKVIPYFSCWKPSGIYFCNCSMEKRLHKDISLVNEQVDYTKGTFIVNEDWYGHQNSTVNFLSDDGKWTLRAFQKETPLMS